MKSMRYAATDELMYITYVSRFHPLSQGLGLTLYRSLERLLQGRGSYSGILEGRGALPRPQPALARVLQVARRLSAVL